MDNDNRPLEQVNIQEESQTFLFTAAGKEDMIASNNYVVETSMSTKSPPLSLMDFMKQAAAALEVEVPTAANGVEAFYILKNFVLSRRVKRDDVYMTTWKDEYPENLGRELTEAEKSLWVHDAENAWITRIGIMKYLLGVIWDHFNELTPLQVGSFKKLCFCSGMIIGTIMMGGLSDNHHASAFRAFFNHPQDGATRVREFKIYYSFMSKAIWMLNSGNRLDKPYFKAMFIGSMARVLTKRVLREISNETVKTYYYFPSRRYFDMRESAYPNDDQGLLTFNNIPRMMGLEKKRAAERLEE